MDINRSVLTHSQGEAPTVLPTEWNACLLKRLQLRRVAADNSPNSWKFFPIPPSWLRNGELQEEKFRLVDQIESRGDRANPVNIYQPLSPKLGPFLYVRRCYSYSIWRVPRPEPVIPQDTHLNKSSGDVLIIHKMTPHLAKRIRALDEDTLRKISSVPPKTWERMKQLPLHIWDAMIAKESEEWNEFMKSVSTEQVDRNGSLNSDTSANRPRDRGDGAACRPSRIPLPIWRLRGPDPTLPRPTTASEPTRQKGTWPHRRQRKAHSKRIRIDESIERGSSSTKITFNAAGSSSTRNKLLTHTKSRAGINATGFTATDCLGKGSASLGSNIEKLNVSSTGYKSRTANAAASTCGALPTGLTHTDITDIDAGSLNLDNAVFCHPWQMEIPVLEPGDVRFRQEERYDELIELGDGRFSTVYLADLTLQQENYVVAVKKFTGALSSPDVIMKEARITKFLADTGFVPRLFGCVHPDLGLVQECYGQGTTLEDLLSSAQDFGLPSETWLSIATQLALGLREFFKRGFLHNDIKSENILVDWTVQGYPIRYIDFGRATYLTGYLFTEETIHLAKKGQLAPDLWFGNITSQASDIFSLGRVLDSISQAGQLWQIGDVARKCVKPDPASRPIIDVIIRDLQGLQHRLHH